MERGIRRRRKQHDLGLGVEDGQGVQPGKVFYIWDGFQVVSSVCVATRLAGIIVHRPGDTQVSSL